MNVQFSLGGRKKPNYIVELLSSSLSIFCRKSTITPFFMQEEHLSKL